MENLPHPHQLKTKNLGYEIGFEFALQLAFLRLVLDLSFESCFVPCRLYTSPPSSRTLCWRFSWSGASRWTERATACSSTSNQTGPVSRKLRYSEHAAISLFNSWTTDRSRCSSWRHLTLNRNINGFGQRSETKHFCWTLLACSQIPESQMISVSQMSRMKLRFKRTHASARDTKLVYCCCVTWGVSFIPWSFGGSIKLGVEFNCLSVDLDRCWDADLLLIRNRAGSNGGPGQLQCIPEQLLQVKSSCLLPSKL